MKKQLLMLMAMGGLFGGFGAAGIGHASAETSLNRGIPGTPRNLDKQAMQETPIRMNRRIVMPSLRYYSFNSGMGPKEYGQDLQRTGRQKWTKKGGKR